jgi:hypothetical protein
LFKEILIDTEDENSHLRTIATSASVSLRRTVI